MTESRRVLITGCDTGLGREFARQYCAEGWNVYASYLDIANTLDIDGNIQHIALDVTQPKAFEILKSEIGELPIDVLLSNAGVGNEPAKFGAIDYDYCDRMYRTNCLATLRLAETFVDNVARSTMRKIVAISSRMGSTAANLTGGHYGYRASKAALNAITRNLAVDLGAQGICVVALHPGAASGQPNSPGALTFDESAERIRELIERLSPHETGQFYRYDGSLLPW